MDYKKLVEDLKSHGLRNGSSLGYHLGLCDVAADSIIDLLARVEKVETERDVAIKELDGVVSMVDDLADFVDREIHPVIDYNLYLSLRENVDAVAMFQHENEWREQEG